MDQAFEIFERNGVQLLAIPQGSGKGLNIVDVAGWTYGSYRSIRAFDEIVQAEGMESLRLNRCKVGIVCHFSPEDD